ncbi:hypothetical protein HRG_006295 [Hirsutella rhossiliensis]|uniref:Uncharacterized protein n=1 Tax=Hirsutella rhossiliensis TaxID=111463 RepID=A0A9P8SGL5_9HYPO|nr:uncharacterized protein HRG_06295 [Hirsutella rhossiliensis]KAH0962193.1 hypothetical protein HRG_06295 [Hirsutella rhossiliensis]
MKTSAVLAVVFAAVAYAKVESANKIKPKDQGLVDAACENLGKIEEGAESCLKKCGISKPQQHQALGLIKKVCDTREK